jgi:hypothetical protein
MRQAIFLTNISMGLGPYNKSGSKGEKYHNLAFQSDSLRSRLKAALQISAIYDRFRFCCKTCDTSDISKPAMRDLETDSTIDPIDCPVYFQLSYLNC